MILLDTNVLSELMRPVPDPRVFAWVDAQPASSLYTASIVVAEILAGIALLPDGQRKSALLDAAERMVAEQFAGRVLSFNAQAAGHYAALYAERRKVGKPLEGFDGLIAATARASGAILATRNARDFEGCGVVLVNPFSDAA